jgi:hypothetical protein
MNQEIAMRIARFIATCRKTTLAGAAAALGIQGLALGWAAPAGAQDTQNQARPASLVERTTVSENATSPAHVSPLSDPHADNRIDSVARGLSPGASRVDTRMAKPPGDANEDRKGHAQTFYLGQTGSPVIHGRNIGGVRKVTTTVMPDAPRASSVTLWDEIVPPKPAPVPEGAAQPVPAGVASSSSQ